MITSFCVSNLTSGSLSIFQEVRCSTYTVLRVGREKGRRGFLFLNLALHLLNSFLLFLYTRRTCMYHTWVIAFCGLCLESIFLFCRSFFSVSRRCRTRSRATCHPSRFFPLPIPHLKPQFVHQKLGRVIHKASFILWSIISTIIPFRYFMTTCLITRREFETASHYRRNSPCWRNCAGLASPPWSKRALYWWVESYIQ